MKLRATLLGIALVLLACGDVTPAADDTTPIEPPTTGSSDGVKVRVTATPVQ